MVARLWRGRLRGPRPCAGAIDWQAMTYRLRGRLRLETWESGGHLRTRAYLDEQELAADPALLSALAAVASGARPSIAQLSALLRYRIFCEERAPVPPLPAETCALSPFVHAELAPAPQRFAGRWVQPEASLPISLFIAPPLLLGLQEIAAQVRAGYARMLSAAASRGLPLAATEAAAVLAPLAAELLAAHPELQQAVTVDTPFRLVPRQPLQTDRIHYPLGPLRLYADRLPAPAEVPLTLSAEGASLGELGGCLGLLGRGVAGDELAERMQGSALLRRVVAALLDAGLLYQGPAPERLQVPPGGVMHLGHATLLANLDGRYVLVDPFLPPRSRRDALAPPWPAALPPLDAVLITHHHWDHLHPETLLKLDKAVPVYVPQQDTAAALWPRTEALLRHLGFARVQALRPGEAISLTPRAQVLAVPFYGEDPTCIGYAGSCYALVHQGRAALVHVDSGADRAGRSLWQNGDAAALVARFGPLSPVFASRRQERGVMAEHTWEFLLQPASLWGEPTENCCNDAAALAALCAATQTPQLVLYAEGGADFFPAGTDFLRRKTPTARTAPFLHLSDPLPAIAAAVAAAGARVDLAEPYQVFAIGGPAQPTQPT